MPDTPDRSPAQDTARRPLPRSVLDLSTVASGRSSSQALAASTSSIRIGSGGVMLPNHAPLVVAEQFAMLEALHPGRVDLGIGRAPGTDQQTALALRRDPAALSAEDFPQHLLDLLGLFGDERVEGGLAERFTATPAAESAPAVLLLG